MESGERYMLPHRVRAEPGRQTIFSAFLVWKCNTARGSGSAVSSPSGSWRSPATKRHLVHFWSENALSGKALASWSLPWSFTGRPKKGRNGVPVRYGPIRTLELVTELERLWIECVILLLSLSLLLYKNDWDKWVRWFENSLVIINTRKSTMSLSNQLSCDLFGCFFRLRIFLLSRQKTVDKTSKTDKTTGCRRHDYTET